MRLTVVGCGDAFGSGGRLQTCFHVAAGGRAFLIDCGATSLIGLKRLGIDANGVSTIFISHLHGDHFAGLAWWLIDALYMARRADPLLVVGPRGIEKRFTEAAEALFPNSTAAPRRFDLRFVEYTDATPMAVDGLTVTAFEVRHPSGAPPYALRFEAGGKTLGFSGDTEWVDNLMAEVRYHMNWRNLEANLDRLAAKRVLITHMNPGMLARRGEVRDPRVVCAEDGMVVDI